MLSPVKVASLWVEPIIKLERGETRNLFSHPRVFAVQGGGLEKLGKDSSAKRAKPEDETRLHFHQRFL